ncbi:MAG: hypothetical protein AB7N99_01250 [Simkaniaceae bacterium]
MSLASKIEDWLAALEDLCNTLKECMGKSLSLCLTMGANRRQHGL